jgi:beta-glucanase (GH16 family)
MGNLLAGLFGAYVLLFSTSGWTETVQSVRAIDQTKWFHETLLPDGSSWHNNEQQHYTNRIENAYISNGSLKIRALKENFKDQAVVKQYTSARLNSKFAFTYGRVEVRAKMPTGKGTWPAIWMLSKNISGRGAYFQSLGFGELSWPDCGEIDIMEHWGDNQNYAQSAIHTRSSHGETVNRGGQYVPTVSTQFHVYSLDWTADELVFEVDGERHYTYKPETKNNDTWPFDSPQYLLLNFAIENGIDPDFIEDSLTIDHVRIYDQAGTLIFFDEFD